MRDNSSKQILLSILGVAILIVAVIGVSFAVFTYQLAGQKENTITTGTITMNYTEGAKGISITNAMPVSDAVGKTFTATDVKSSGEIGSTGAGLFDFSVSATISGTVSIKYDVIAVKQSTSTLDEKYAKLYLQKSAVAGYTTTTDAKTPTVFSSLGAISTATTTAGKAAGSSAKVLYSGTFSATKTDYFRLRMWVDQSYNITGTSKTFAVKINVYGEAA